MLSKNDFKNVSTIWFVPFIAILIGIFLLYRHYSSIGETVYISSDNADSIVAGKTEIKYHSVTIGKIVSVKLSEDLSTIVFKAIMNREADNFLVEDAKFVLVKPRINAQGVSGLDTLLSGVYIELYPGTSSEKRNYFDLVDQQVTIGTQTKGTYIHLNDYSLKGSSLVGEPVTYHGYKVGDVIESEFSISSRRMEHVAFIYSPYDSLVTSNTKFWYSSSLDMSLGPDGINVRVASLENFINGGVSFDVPKGLELGKPVVDHFSFPLYAKEADIYQQDFHEGVDYVILLSGNNKTMDAGSKVMHLGIQVGEVIDSDYDNENLFEEPSKIKIPVVIRIQKGRVDPKNRLTFEEFKKRIDSSIANGLSATIDSSFIGNNSVVSLSYNSEISSENYSKSTFNGYKVIPNFASGIGSLQNKIGMFLDNLNHLNLGKTNDKINNMVDELTNTIKELHKLVSNLEKFTDDSKRMEMMSSINGTLIQLQKTLDSYSEHSEMYNEMTSLLSGIRDMIKTLNPNIRKTNENPNRFIFGDDGSDDAPKAGR